MSGDVCLVLVCINGKRDVGESESGQSSWCEHPQTGFQSTLVSLVLKAAPFVHMNVVSDCDFGMSLFFMDTS